MKTYDRILHKNLCNYCGSSYDTYFDEKHDETICLECINIERIKAFENEENDEDEDQANERVRLKTKHDEEIYRKGADNYED